MADPLNIIEQIKIAVSLAEGQFREFKSAYQGPPDAKQPRNAREICRDVAEALVAFANADGGELIIGVEDDGALSGTNDLKPDAIEKIKSAPIDHVHKDTPLQSVLTREANIDGKQVIYFRVSKGTKLIHLTSDGRCLRRNDLETVPVPAEQIQFDRQETISREYDREFVDGASVTDLDIDLVEAVAEQISAGISVDRCLQYLGLADYEGGTGLRLRRAALLLFSKNPERWHPRLQSRIIKVKGTELGAGADYNVAADTTIRENILQLVEGTWDQLRPHLVETRFQEDARFKTTYLFPEIACREALVNAIAHRDYSDEGRGIEVFVFDNRIEIVSPGGLLSSISVKEIESLRGAHQSRNSYVARSLREAGLMRELGEGMRRIFEVMHENELAPPTIISSQNEFRLSLHHRPMYAEEELIWLEQFDSIDLSAEHKAVLLLGRRGDLIAPNDVFRRLGIVDTDKFRQIIEHLQKNKVLESVARRSLVQREARKKGVGMRDIPRFKVVLPGRDIKRRSRAQRKNDGNVSKDGVKEHERREDIKPTTGIFVSNLPPNTTERDIMLAIKDLGVPESIVIPRKDGYSKGFAFVEFDDPNIVDIALRADIVVGHRKLSVRRIKPRIPKKP